MPATAGPLLLGASGQVGYFLLQRLGGEAVACARTIPAWSSPQQANWRTFDLWTSNEASTQTQLISAGPLDACVAWLERAGPGALRRIVALSSMSAVHKRHSVSRVERALADSLCASEQRLLAFASAHDIHCMILRPTLIWGAGMDRSLTPFAQAAARRGFAFVPARATGLRQPVHAEDLAVLCLALSVRDEAATGVFEAAGGERLTLAAMLARVGRSVGARVIRVSVPSIVLAAVGRIAAAAGIDVAAAWTRAVSDQCASTDAVWHYCDLSPRGFTPTRDSWMPPT